MTASNIGEDCYIGLARPGPLEYAVGSIVPSTAEHSISGAVAQRAEPMRSDRYEASVELGSIQAMSRAGDQTRLADQRKTLESQLLRDYQRVAKDSHHRVGANKFLAYLEAEHRSLAEVNTRDLEEWALTPVYQGNVPSARFMKGAKGLCAFAAQVGYIDAHCAKDIAQCSRPQIDVNVLRCKLQNPLLTSEERESHIFLNYKIAERNVNRHRGAKDFLAHLHSEKKNLAEVTTSDLGRWSLMLHRKGQGKSNVPKAEAFDGAKALCALAAEVGYIQAQSATDFSAYMRPQFDLGSLRLALQNPLLTRKDQEYAIQLYVQSVDNEPKHHTGASAFLEYLESQARSLAEATTSDLERWALTPVTSNAGKVAVPHARAFEGAKRLCALAAELGYIDLQRAKDLAECQRPLVTVDSLRHVLQNPFLTPKEREHHIYLNYESSENNTNRHTGATSFRAYLEKTEIPLAEVCRSYLNLWALTPLKSSGNLPDVQAFAGAKALCALAAQVGHIDAHRGQELATSKRPQRDVNLLRTALQNPDLTCEEREYQIHLHYQSLETDFHRQSGASRMMAYLKSQGRSLSELTTSDLKDWALTPIANGNLPNVRAFEGAKALCALAGEVGHIDAPRAQDLAQCLRPQGDVNSLRLLLQNPELTPKERDYHIHLNYQSSAKNADRQSGASNFLAYLERQDRSLAEVSKRDLEMWALTSIATGETKKTVPTSQAFEGAKALCALATQVGHLDAQRGQAIATCPRPRFDTDSLRIVLQNPALTAKERENHIRLNYQSSVNHVHLTGGANGFLAHLGRAGIPLAEVTKSNLEEWALTPYALQGKPVVPSPRAFKGAKGLCAMAAEVGYIDAQSAKEIAACPRPHFEVDFLRIILENSALTGPDRESQICLNYQSMETNVHRQAGANGFLAYLGKQGSSLGKVTKRDVEQWALTQIAAGHGKGALPSRQAFAGVKALCALAAEVGYIDAQRASEIADCRRPQSGVASRSRARRSEAGLQTAQNSRAILERANKRLRSDDQGASTSISHSFALPQSDVLFRELALSPPSLLDPNQDARSPQTAGTRSLIDELENLEDMLGSCGHLY